MKEAPYRLPSELLQFFAISFCDRLARGSPASKVRYFFGTPFRNLIRSSYLVTKINFKITSGHNSIVKMQYMEVRIFAVLRLESPVPFDKRKRKNLIPESALIVPMGVIARPNKRLSFHSSLSMPL